MAKTVCLFVLLTGLGLALAAPSASMVPRTRLIHTVDVPLELRAQRLRQARVMLHSAGYRAFLPGELPADGTHRGSVLCDGPRVVYPRTPNATAAAFCKFQN